MPRPKDGKLSRIYFHVIPEVVKLAPDFLNEVEATDWLQKIQTRAWFVKRWKARYPADSSPTIFPRGVRFASARSAQRCTAQAARRQQFMALDENKKNPLEALHILAHALQPAEGAWHGAEWSQAYLDLIERAFHVGTRREVKKILLANKIKTRVVTEASRANYKAAYETRQGRDAKTEAQKMLAELREMEGRNERG